MSAGRCLFAVAIAASACTRQGPTCTQVPTCSPDGRQVVRCADQGGLEVHTCAADEACDSGACLPKVCKPGFAYCDREVADVCNAAGTVEKRTDCEDAGLTCVQDAAGARCAFFSCMPGRLFCSPEGDDVLRCNPDGQTTEEVEECEDPQMRGNGCQNGVCVDRCGLAQATRSTLGCDFFVAPLGRGSAPAALVYNPQPDLPATVVLADGSGLQTGAVAAANGYALLAWAQPAQADGTAVGRALELTSTVPVYAWQLADPAAGEGAVLLPAHALGTRHVVAVDGAAGDELVAVVASAPATQVTVTPTVATRAGGALPAFAAGQPANVTLGRGDLLVLFAGAPGLSGTTIDASAPVAVFAAASGAGHAEAAVLPWAALGTRYALPAGTATVVAREDGTHVTVGGATVALAAGQAARVDGPRLVAADRPLAVVVANASGMATVVPDEQRLAASGVVLRRAGAVTIVARDPAFTFDGEMCWGDLVDGAYALDRRDGVPAGAHRAAGSPHALYLDDGAALLTGPFALDPVNP